MPRRSKPHPPGPQPTPEAPFAPGPEEPLDAPPPAIAFFLQHASRSELAVAYKALVGLLVGGEEGLGPEEARVAREMYLALQRELDRALHRSILPHGEESPLPF